jgi:hypothetical protein
MDQCNVSYSGGTAGSNARNTPSCPRGHGVVSRVAHEPRRGVAAPADLEAEHEAVALILHDGLPAAAREVQEQEGEPVSGGRVRPRGRRG